MSSEIIPVTPNIELRAVDERYISELHHLVVKNKARLQTAFDWAQHVGSEDDTRRNVQSNQMLHQRGYAKMFLIFLDDQLTGVLSFNAIEPANKTGYIGYWLDEEHHGQGIVSQALQAFIRYYAGRGKSVDSSSNVGLLTTTVTALHSVTVSRSKAVCAKAEFLNGRFDDVNLYAKIVAL